MSKPVLVFLLLSLAGCVYGYFSAKENWVPAEVNVPPEAPHWAREAAQKAKSWEPSPRWLPSYILTQIPRGEASEPEPPKGTITRFDKDGKPVTLPDEPQSRPRREPRSLKGFGLQNMGGGYFFTSAANKSEYVLLSILVGGAMGFILAILASIPFGWITLRKKEEKEEKGETGA